MEFKQYKALQKCYPDGTPVEPPVYIKDETYEIMEYDTIEECETGIVIPKYCIGWQMMILGQSPYVEINGVNYKLSENIYYNGEIIGTSNQGYFCIKTEDEITSLKFTGTDLRYVNLCNFPLENLTNTDDIFPTNSNLIEIIAPEEFLNSLPEHWQDPSIYLIPCGTENIFTWEGGDTIYYYLNATSPVYTASDHSEDLGISVTVKTLQFNNTNNSSDDNAITSIDISNIYKKFIDNCSNMFATCTKLETINLGSMSLPSDASGMFYQCYLLNNIQFGSIDTSKCEDMSGMFYMNRNNNFAICSTFNTSNVKYFNSMFYGSKIT